jgi:hypothetical protein
MKLKARIISIALLALAALQAAAQTNQKQQVLQELKLLSSKYYSGQQVGFDITYRSSKVGAPGVYLDSLKGSFKMSGDRYWYSVDSMETIGNKEMAVILFKEDAVMYLSKPSYGTGNTSPLVMIDSFFINNKDFDFAISSQQDETQITLTSKKQGDVKRIDYFISKKTGLLARMVNTVNARLMYDDMAQQSLEKAATYVSVEMLFSNYRFLQADASMPDIAQYFKKEGQQYVAQPPYQSYKIFLGSPNL